MSGEDEKNLICSNVTERLRCRRNLTELARTDDENRDGEGGKDGEEEGAIVREKDEEEDKDTEEDKDEYENRELLIPLSWMFDDVEDCEEGLDESHIKVRQCKFEGRLMDAVRRGSRCWEEFKCKGDEVEEEEEEEEEEEKSVKLSHVCRNEGDCEGCNEVCEFAKRKTDFVKRPDPRGDVNTTRNTAGNITKVFALCLESEEFLQNSGNEVCDNIIFAPPGLEKRKEMLVDIRIPNPGLIDCENVFGEGYVYLACEGRCSKSTKSNCPLQKHNTCKNGEFLCEDKNTSIPHSKVCNLEVDCPDGSDEEKCDNNFKCTSGVVQYLPVSTKCNGVVDCWDLSDECLPECPLHTRYILGNPVLKMIACVIGCLSILLNYFNILRVGNEFSKTKWFRSAVTRQLIIFIAVGDFLMGCYLATVTFIDISNGEYYCRTKYLWLSSRVCAVLGVMSSCGSQMSIFAMTVLAIFRAFTIRSSRIAKESSVSDWAKTKLRSLAIIITAMSVGVAIVPMLDRFEDFFVTSLHYDENPIFIGGITKQDHIKLLEPYYNTTYTALSWKEIRVLVRGMFTEHQGGLEGTNIHFYGSDGVCLTKYLVTPDDPQRVFTLTLLLVNFLCFAIICGSYLSINLHTSKKKPGNSSTPAASPKTNRSAHRARNRKLRVKTGAIIGTDFVCWIPLILVCLLHHGRYVDARPFYPFFSVVILPINSLINPLLYDSRILESIFEKGAIFFTFLRKSSCASVNTMQAEVTIVNSVAMSTTGIIQDPDIRYDTDLQLRQMGAGEESGDITAHPVIANETST